MNFKSAAEFLLMLKQAEDVAPQNNGIGGDTPEEAMPEPGVDEQEGAPLTQGAVESDFINRVRAVAMKTIFLEEQLGKAQETLNQVGMENQQLQGQLDMTQQQLQEAQQVAQQAMEEGQMQSAEREQLLNSLAQSFDEYKQAIVNIAQQMPGFADIVTQTKQEDIQRQAEAQQQAEMEQAGMVPAEVPPEQAATQQPPEAKVACLLGRRAALRVKLAQNKEGVTDKVLRFLSENPNPEDEQMHSLAEGLNMKPDDLEEHVYSLLGSFVKDKRVLEPDSAFDSSELAQGEKVEKEHTDVPALKKIITKGHLVEIPQGYYPALLGVEDALKKAK